MKRIYISLLLIGFSAVAFAQNHQTGMLFDDDAYQQTPMKARNVAFQDVVSEQTSTSLKKFVPLIRNQGGYGTCVGWSSAYYGRTILNARINNILDRDAITEEAFAPVFVYLNANNDDDYNCQGGAYISRALQTMTEFGTPHLSDYDLMCDLEIPDQVWELAKENRIKDYTRLFGDPEPVDVKLESVKRSLINGNPVIIGMNVENSLYTAKNVFEPDNLGITGGHAMCVIGYDDEKYGGAFEIVNSWGPNWGNDGFIWVRYSDFVEYTKYAYEMIPSPKPKKEIKQKLAGSLKLKLSSGGYMSVAKETGEYKKTVLGFQDVVVDEETQSIGDYVTTEQYPENTRYRMITEVSKPSYVYVIGADSKGQSGVLFPHSDEVSAYINYENTSVIVPGEKYWFRLGGDVESDYSIVIFSLDKIDLDEVMEKMDTMEGEILDKLYVLFKDQLIPQEDITLSDDEMGFHAEFTEGSMALLILDIKRS